VPSRFKKRALSMQPRVQRVVSTSPIPEGFRELQWFGYAGILVIFGIASSIPATGFARFLEEEQLGVALFASRLVLFCVLVVLAAQWFIATQKELEMWRKYLDFHSEPAEAQAAILLIALYLGLSMAFVGRALLLTSFFSLGLMCNIWTQWLCNSTFAKAVKIVGVASVPKSMLNYWNYSQTVWNDSQLIRITVMTIISCMAFGFALAGARKAEPSRTTFWLIAYWILVADITVGEIVVSFWRRTRNRGINDHTRSKGASHGA
jgi:hypothetical protein